MKQAIVIGSGFSGLSAACFLANAGWKVTILEKNSTPGGRARQFSEAGFTFDMGPSWYWMPDVFERFFNQFNKKVSDYYELDRLNPSYKIFWQDDEINIPADFEELKNLFNSLEENGAEKLEQFLKEAEYKYRVGINKLVHKPGLSVLEFADTDLIKGVFKLDVFANMSKHVAKYFTNPKLKQLLEFPVLFLGALPKNIPALYSLMNYADLVGGTWYPKKGMYSIVDGMYQLAVELGVEFYFDEEVIEIVVENGRANQVKSKKSKAKNLDQKNNEQGTMNAEVLYKADVIIASSDYHHTETKLLEPKYQTYTAKYWESRVMAPSCLLYYVGLNKKLNNLLHHNLFFDTDFDQHGKEIYDSKVYPTDPMFYLCAPSITDETVAPKGFENLFFLIPIASGLENDTEELRKKYFDVVVERLEKRIGESIKDAIVYYKSYATSNFIEDYNSFKGNAYGLANTLLQTSILKPSCRSKKVENLFYTGQLTVPGPGIPPSLISGEVVAGLVNNLYK
ncbi:MAG: phytoene desaturase [Chitinophagaceae bacterium]|nr:phytoene desaturase [Chitinophagaceae bacterium]